MNKKFNDRKSIFDTFESIIYFLFSIIKEIFKLTPTIYKYTSIVLNFFYDGIVNIFKKFKRLFHFSLTFKITVVYAFSFFILLFILSTAILISFEFFLTKQSTEQVEKNVTIVKNYIKTSDTLPIDIIDDTAYREDINVTIFNNEKKVIHSTEKNEDEIHFFATSDNLNYIDIKNRNLIVLNNYFDVNNKIYYIQITKNLEEQNTYIQVLLSILVGCCTIGIILIILFGSRLSKKMLLPIRTMTSTVKAISISDLNTRLDINDTQDELKDLTVTFNDMLNRLESSYERQNQFVSDASHELRTPISVIQGYANLLDRWGKNDKQVLEEAITSIKNESENMKDLIEQLLFLARSDKKTQQIEKSLFSINELIEEVVKETKLIDPSHTILDKTNQEISTYADRKLLKQALRIFVDNSVKFTPNNGLITVSAYIKKKNIILVIEDTGSGIPPEDLPNIFDRFYRADKSRTKKSGGTGLGLSIAKWIIAQHHGSIEVESYVDVGTKISISFPVKDSQSNS